jgi:polysaccharide biosynthesis/export protein
MAGKAIMMFFGKPWLFVVLFVLLPGCTTARPCCLPDPNTLPSELRKFSIAEYRISPPDILLIDAVRLVPRPPYKISPLDALVIQVFADTGIIDEKTGQPDTDILPRKPINSIYRVEPDGTVNLGFTYGTVSVVGQTLPEAKETIKNYLLMTYDKLRFDVQVQLAEAKTIQQVRGPHLVRPDGKVNLGSYGAVFVAGMTPEEAKTTIQNFLSIKLLDPEISLDISGFNSMVYYVIFDQPASGQSVSRLPYEGNETVLDAIGLKGGLPPGIDRAKIWVARPTSPEEGCDKILPVDWNAITQRGSPATNYQLLPGDRIFVKLDGLVETDSVLAKVLAPVERVFGILLLGQSTVVQFKPSNNGTNGNNGGI